MPKIQIGTDIINFPNSGTDALWSPAVIQFAEAVADKLAALASEYDIPPQVQNLNSDSNTNLVINNAAFAGNVVRKFSFNYAIYRATTDLSVKIAEAGTLTAVYNTGTSSWDFEDQYVGDRQANGESYHLFDVNSSGQVLLTTVAIGSPYDSTNSRISFSGKTEKVNN